MSAVSPSKSQKSDALGTLQELIQPDMEAVNRLIVRSLYSEVELVGQLGHYIVNSGGKRLRPALVLLSAGACEYQGTLHINLAAIIEFIHTATLLHDDVVDDSMLRRGKETANAIWGNEASVLVGDFLYSRAFEMMVEVGDMRVMDILSHATNTIAEGEVMQLLNVHDPDTTEERYLAVIYAKTARLFEAGSQLGAVIAGRSENDEKALADYGKYLGTAFQLVDDVLDYSATADELGKNVGDDLAEGKPTLPLIYAMAHGSEAQADQIRQAIREGGLDHIAEITETIESTGAIAYTARLARQEADKAIAALGNIPDSPYKQSLIDLANFSVDRTY
jgi:octaprenyl-diphosphate synthase